MWTPNLYLRGALPIGGFAPATPLNPDPRKNAHLAQRGHQLLRSRAIAQSQGLAGLGILENLSLPVIFGAVAVVAGGYLITKSLRLL